MRRRLQNHFRAQLISGLLLVVPLAITYVVLSFLWGTFVDVLRPALDRLPGPVPRWALSVSAIAALAILVYILGLIGRTIVGRRIVSLWERLLDSIPLVRPIYRIARETTHLVAGASLQASQVVLLHYPRQGVLSVGLVTGSFERASGEVLVAVYIPSAITPTAGWLVFVKKDEVIETELTFEDAIKMTISAGVLARQVTEARQRALQGGAVAPGASSPEGP